MDRINPNKDMKTGGHISFEMLGSYFGQGCRDLRYMYLNVNKTKTVLGKTSCLVDYKRDHNSQSQGRYKYI